MAFRFVRTTGLRYGRNNLPSRSLTPFLSSTRYTASQRFFSTNNKDEKVDVKQGEEEQGKGSSFHDSHERQSSDSASKRPVNWGVVFVTAILCGVGVTYFQRKRMKEAVTVKHGRVVGRPKLGGLSLSLLFSSHFIILTSIANLYQHVHVVKHLSLSLSLSVCSGPYSLIDVNGQEVSDKNFRGKYQLIYFGFINCPDICPTELRKLESALEKLNPSIKDSVVPVFISIDPSRDTPAALKQYSKEWTDRIVWLTGF